LIPAWFWAVTVFLYGITIGSFLNVVIYRLPRGGSLNDPKFSFCPTCERRLQPLELVPLVSFLALGRRCRGCRQPISWRYFCVELLTGLLFLALYARFPHSPADLIALLLFSAALVPIFFIDLATFEIQDSLNLFALAVAVARDAVGIALQEPAHAPLLGWLPRSVVGGAAGALLFGAVRVIGWLWKRQEAMGYGDVLLARALGAMLISFVPADSNPLRLFPIWTLLSCLSGIVVGPALILARMRRQPAAEERGGTEAEEDLPYADAGSTLGEQLFQIGQALWLADLKLYVQDLVARGAARHGGKPERAPEPPDEDFALAPTAIPFGPFLIIGFLATIFAGNAITAWYLAWAFKRPPAESVPGE
jgi:leader peptidase (prepilin peptidase)/N-methyltransferase